MLHTLRFFRWIVICTLLLTLTAVSGSAQTLSASTAPIPSNRNIVTTPDLSTSISFLHTAGNASQATIAIDPAGGIHIASSPVGTAGNSTYPAYYAFCSSGCSDEANWTILQLENLGFVGGEVRLALDSSGHPRMVWIRRFDLGDGEFRYAECDTHCNNIANWTVGNTGPSYLSDNSPYFALDNLNRPRLIIYNYTYGWEGTYYRFCDAGCTNPDHWWETLVTSDQLSNPVLVFTSSGQPRFIANYVGGSELELRYYSCDSGCDDTGNWSYILLTTGGVDMSYSLLLDYQNRPRIALYTGYRNFTDDNQLEYLWCDSGCTISSDNWYEYIIGLDEYYGVNPALALDIQNRPKIAFYTDWEPYALGYVSCTGQCETANPVWDVEYIETSEELNLIEPVETETGCSISSWFTGKKPSLALNSTGNPFFAFDAEHMQGGTCYAHTDISLVRYAISSGGGGGGTTYIVLLPMVVR